MEKFNKLTEKFNKNREEFNKNREKFNKRCCQNQFFIGFVFLSLLVILQSPLHATSGSTDYGYGAISKSMGGVGVAFPLDTFVSAINPAGLVFVDHRFDFNGEYFSPRRGYNATSVSSPFGVAPGTHYSRSNWFILPSLGYVKPIYEQQLAFGISLYPNGGMNTNYSTNIRGSTIAGNAGVYGGGGGTGVDFKQLFLNVGLSGRIHPNLAVGISIIPAVQSIKLKGLLPFRAFSADPINVSDKGTQYSTGGGVRFGLLFLPSPFFSFGAAYQPQITMSRFTKYAGLFENSGSINMPANGTMGVAFMPTANFNLNLDLQRIWYGDVPAYGDPNICSLTSFFPCLGIPGGAGFGWQDTTVYKIGGQWAVNDFWILRAGYAYSTQPILSSQTIFNIISPATPQKHYTAGFTRKINPRWDLNMNFLYVPKITVTGPNQFNVGQRLQIFMSQYEIGASLSWRMGYMGNLGDK